MKTLFITTLSLLILHLGISAQEVISTGGDFFIHELGSISFTFGEPVIETFTGTSKILTQGYQQSKLIIIPTDDDNQLIKIKAEPNPTNNLIKITIENPIEEKLSFKVLDSNGKVLIHDQFSPPSSEIYLGNLKSSLYLLKVYSSKKLVKTIKIIKQ